MQKRLVLSIFIALSCLNFVFSQNFNERDSLKRIVKILNNVIYEFREGSFKEYEIYYHWKVKKDTVFGESGSFFFNDSRVSFPSSCVSFMKLYFENGKLVMNSFSQAESQSEILILNSNIIKVQGLDESGKCCLTSERYKSTIKTPKRVKRYLRI